ncbi:hypothetical protein LMHCC_1780 [Listeria monocytogenes HCC23]|uniref:Uncharacterized protein n=1 Tax=Listeria monocytogenes serotype 4a (strain M7) TaxID=1030009 RepID=A0A0E0UU86_LISMM|nr:hypothetical protein LMHCC_1780 [Listeria monocytogenes HCC23]AEH91884.1 hypothetical protein LMM7_0879 [Listeria monocytogenes M7]
MKKKELDYNNDFRENNAVSIIELHKKDTFSARFVNNLPIL